MQCCIKIEFFFLSPLVPECEKDPHCHTTKYCELSNLTCADPCIRDPCGPNAFGTPFNHVCNCQCIEGFTGNPKTGCSKPFAFNWPFVYLMYSIVFCLYFSTDTKANTTTHRLPSTRHRCQLSGWRSPNFCQCCGPQLPRRHVRQGPQQRSQLPTKCGTGRSCRASRLYSQIRYLRTVPLRRMI